MSIKFENIKSLTAHRFVQRYGDHACNNVLRLVAASLFTIFISTCTMINFKLIVSKNENK